MPTHSFSCFLRSCSASECPHVSHSSVRHSASQLGSPWTKRQWPQDTKVLLLPPLGDVLSSWYQGVAVGPVDRTPSRKGHVSSVDLSDWTNPEFELYFTAEPSCASHPSSLCCPCETPSRIPPLSRMCSLVVSRRRPRP